MVFDYSGDFYVAVPLDAPKRANPDVRLKLQQEAHLLANLFASFEKEKIFKRSMLPTNATIRRKLERQGSKFAGSDSFRVYRFKDGAWSDIILGAVMGASKRAETERRRLRVEAGPELPVPQEAATSAAAMAAATGYPPVQPMPTTAVDPTRPGGGDTRPAFPLVPPAASARRYGDASLGTHPAAGARTSQRARTAAQAPVPTGVPARGAAAPALNAQFGAYAPGAAAELGSAFAMDASGEPRTQPSRDYRRTASAFQNVERARATVSEADVEVVRADNSNTATAARPVIGAVGAGSTAEPRSGGRRTSSLAAEANGTDELPRFVRSAGNATAAAHRVEAAPMPENVIPLPRPTASLTDADVTEVLVTEIAQAAPLPADSDRDNARLQVAVAEGLHGIDVTVSRETATFTLPTSEGRLPQALAELARRAAATFEVPAQPARVAAQPHPVIAAAEPVTPTEPILLPGPAASSPPADEPGPASDAEAAAAAAAAVLEAAEGLGGDANGHAYAIAGLDREAPRSIN